MTDEIPINKEQARTLRTQALIRATVKRDFDILRLWADGSVEWEYYRPGLDR